MDSLQIKNSIQIRNYKREEEGEKGGAGGEWWGELLAKQMRTKENHSKDVFWLPR